MDRRASFISLFLGSLVSLSAIVSTGACGSVPDLRFDDGDAGNISAGEGGVDARRDVDPNCKKTGPEICDDGIDNDCNGDVDCQDSACGGFSCQDAPAGWTAVGFAAAERPSCPSGESESDLKVVSGDGSATCACSCNAVGGSCATNDFALKLTTENTCGVAPTMANIPPSAANCTALGASINVPGGAFAKIAGVPPASCAASASPTGGLLTSGRLCQANRFGTGCAPDQVCAPKPSKGINGCVTKTGADACPAGFGKRSTAGAVATDGRTCTGCVCAPPAPCSGGSVSVYDGSMCKTNGVSQGATGITGACAATSDSGFTATHFKSTPAVGGCAGTPTTPATPGGALTFTEQRTVCCR